MTETRGLKLVLKNLKERKGFGIRLLIVLEVGYIATNNILIRSQGSGMRIEN